MNDRRNQSSYDSLFGDPAEAPDRTETVIVPPADSLDQILAEVRNNHSCGACKPGMPVVFGAGPANAALMLIGEGPGIDDIKSGLPFQGQAGVLLARMLAAINLSPAECYICNVIKCVPSGERNFSVVEIEGCRPFLLRQILAVNPRLIVAFGALAAQTLLRSKKTISELRGRRYCLQLNERRFALIPIFNPAYLLRVAEKKREAWEDLKMVREFLRG
ncbi:MAG: uracil-DNA glycosylase [Blastocatellia bacterium]|nr:uracil-DNA glycosylase [Blastocatellia bacterium]